MASKFPDQAEIISRFCHFTTESSRILPPIQGLETQPLVSLQEAVQPLVSLLPQINQMVWTVEENYHASNDDLSKDEITSIMLYTLEWTPSENSFYIILNATLRSENRKQLLPWFLYLRLFINAISKLPSNPHPIIYRGIHMDLSNDYPEGKEFIWWSFTSCTSSLNVLKNFIGQDGARTIFNILCHSAKDISRYSCHEEEKEVLCYPARTFRVKSCLNAGYQLYIIELEEIQSKFPFFHIPPTLNFPIEESNNLINSMNSSQCNLSSLRSLSSLDEFINILLLSETNVDQLTFIKTFINSLKFESHEQVESNVRLSSIDQSSQHYRSYVVVRLDGKKLRLINTQDLEIEQILKYINQFPYLNAVCLLIKSNTTQLNTFFRTSLPPLFDFLGPNARKNLIFCFTDTRLNSFNLENIIQLLKTILHSLSMNDIPLQKENTFYFDTESFINRLTSIIELNHLIDYLNPCRMQGKYQSFKQAQFEIIPMIRPILETMRNILRNMIVQQMNLTRQFIQLNPKIIHRTATRCLSCKSHICRLGDFWIVTDDLHEIEETCYSCSCSLDQHILMDYQLEYELSDYVLDNNQYQMKDRLSELWYISAQFAFFLIHVARSTNDDPFCFYLTQMIDEENNLSLTQQPNYLNLQLVHDLKSLKTDYEKQFNDIKTNHQYGTLPEIYKWIQTIQQYPMIHEQMIAIKQGQEIIMKHYEYESE